MSQVSVIATKSAAELTTRLMKSADLSLLNLVSNYCEVLINFITAFFSKSYRHNYFKTKNYRAKNLLALNFTIIILMPILFGKIIHFLLTLVVRIFRNIKALFPRKPDPQFVQSTIHDNVFVLILITCQPAMY